MEANSFLTAPFAYEGVQREASLCQGSKGVSPFASCFLLLSPKGSSKRKKREPPL